MRLYSEQEQDASERLEAHIRCAGRCSITRCSSLGDLEPSRGMGGVSVYSL